ncbi:MAG: LuxR C-terminal-related transcriptional regulator [Bacteroidales bacterium]|nr:LuxR C-terminal-related transcriptional regulator [Bacteroidales bacterium]
MITNLTIAVIVGSPWIKVGLQSYLSQLRSPSFTLLALDPSPTLVDEILAHNAHAIIAEPLLFPPPLVETLRHDMPRECHIIAMTSQSLPALLGSCYDDVVSIYDPIESLVAILQRLAASDNEEDTRSQELSPREREIVIALVKGHSNKEIAAQLCVSVNTVMTHRRNITSKLQIHSLAGLTIYAIVSNLVKLEEIKDSIPT